jgi:hypothetical protein
MAVAACGAETACGFAAQAAGVVGSELTAWLHAVSAATEANATIVEKRTYPNFLFNPELVEGPF